MERKRRWRWGERVSFLPSLCLKYAIVTVIVTVIAVVVVVAAVVVDERD